jgi:prolyl oligopeptidase
MEVPVPVSRREDVVDVVHDVEVADPYRWLEAGDDPDVMAWAEAQNAVTRQALDGRAERPVWLDRLVELLGVTVITSPRLCADRVFTLERSGGAPQFTLVVRSAADADAPARTLLDPSSMTADSTAAIDWFHPSRDGRYVAYGVSEGGDERSVLRVLDVDSGDHLIDEIPETRAASVGWLPDNSGFFYTRYPEGDEYHRMVYEHRLGRRWVDDPRVWSDLPTPESWPDVSVSLDGNWVLVHVLVGWGRYDVHLLDRAAGTWRTVIEGEDALNSFRVDGDRLLGTTTLGAPRGRVVSAPLDDPSTWTTIIPEGEGVIDGLHLAGSSLLVQSTRSAVAHLHHYDHDGRLVGEVALPELGAFAGMDGADDRPVAFCSLEGFTRPASLMRWTPEGGLSAWAGGAALDLPAMTVSQERYASADGTPIGLFLIHRADVVLAADTPSILTGYGGFAIASTPAYSALVAAWCEAGGLFAVAGLRGGYEEGEEWHRAGRRDVKQRVFDDFHGAADHLVSTGRTSRARLALRGGSNGGLLVGAALTQRPDLARAVHCAVPLLDMVRFPQFLIARLWTDEYGDPDIAEEFGWLYAYSPYHHVVPGTCYPAVLFTCAEGDSRVDPLHARKMAAALQYASSCMGEHPVLLRQESRAGHGVGKPLQKQADEAADVLTFFTWQLGGPYP